MFVVLVCGGRNYNNYERVITALNAVAEAHSRFYRPYENWLPSDIKIVTGGASGADRHAVDWAVVNWCEFREYPADWNKHGRAAGPIRNQLMLDTEHPNLVVAFPGGRGTADMVRRARAAGVPVLEIPE